MMTNDFVEDPNDEMSTILSQLKDSEESRVHAHFGSCHCISHQTQNHTLRMQWCQWWQAHPGRPMLGLHRRTVFKLLEKCQDRGGGDLDEGQAEPQRGHYWGGQGILDDQDQAEFQPRSMGGWEAIGQESPFGQDNCFWGSKGAGLLLLGPARSFISLRRSREWPHWSSASPSWRNCH